MEQFLACHQHAFEFFGNRVPERIMVDNLKCKTPVNPMVPTRRSPAQGGTTAGSAR
jgi:transposase